MIRDKKELDHRPIEIDLTGPEGNVFCLMAYAKKYARQLYDFMTDELEDAQSGSDAVEERARSELGMIRNQETFFEVILEPTEAMQEPNIQNTSPSQIK